MPPGCSAALRDWAAWHLGREAESYTLRARRRLDVDREGALACCVWSRAEGCSVTRVSPRVVAVQRGGGPYPLPGFLSGAAPHYFAFGDAAQRASRCGGGGGSGIGALVGGLVLLGCILCVALLIFNREYALCWQHCAGGDRDTGRVGHDKLFCTFCCRAFGDLWPCRFCMGPGYARAKAKHKHHKLNPDFAVGDEVEFRGREAEWKLGVVTRVHTDEKTNAPVKVKVRAKNYDGHFYDAWKVRHIAESPTAACSPTAVSAASPTERPARRQENPFSSLPARRSRGRPQPTEPISHPPAESASYLHDAPPTPPPYDAGAMSERSARTPDYDYGAQPARYSHSAGSGAHAVPAAAYDADIPPFHPPADDAQRYHDERAALAGAGEAAPAPDSPAFVDSLPRSRTPSAQAPSAPPGYGVVPGQRPRGAEAIDQAVQVYYDGEGGYSGWYACRVINCAPDGQEFDVIFDDDGALCEGVPRKSIRYSLSRGSQQWGTPTPLAYAPSGASPGGY